MKNYTDALTNAIYQLEKKKCISYNNLNHQIKVKKEKKNIRVFIEIEPNYSYKGIWHGKNSISEILSPLVTEYKNQISLSHISNEEDYQTDLLLNTIENVAEKKGEDIAWASQEIKAARLNQKLKNNLKQYLHIDTVFDYYMKTIVLFFLIFAAMLFWSSMKQEVLKQEIINLNSELERLEK